MTIWLLTPNQKRYRLIDAFSPAFYVYGPEPRLIRLGQALAKQACVTARFTERINLWENRAIAVLEVSVQDPTQLRSRAYWVHQFDSDLVLFNSDLMLASVYCWKRKVFPLARIEVETNENGTVIELECRDDEWAIGYELPPFEIMHLRLGGLSRIDPQHGRRTALEIEVDGREYELDESGEPAAPRADAPHPAHPDPRGDPGSPLIRRPARGAGSTGARPPARPRSARPGAR